MATRLGIDLDELVGAVCSRYSRAPFGKPPPPPPLPPLLHHYRRHPLLPSAVSGAGQALMCGLVPADVSAGLTWCSEHPFIRASGAMRSAATRPGGRRRRMLGGRHWATQRSSGHGTLRRRARRRPRCSLSFRANPLAHVSKRKCNRAVLQTHPWRSHCVI